MKECCKADTHLSRSNSTSSTRKSLVSTSLWICSSSSSSFCRSSLDLSLSEAQSKKTHKAFLQILSRGGESRNRNRQGVNYIEIYTSIAWRKTDWLLALVINISFLYLVCLTNSHYLGESCWILPGMDTNFCSSFFRRVISLHSWMSSILHRHKHLCK